VARRHESAVWRKGGKTLRSTRTRALAGAFLSAASLAALVIAPSASGLSPSTFESTDGNTAVNGAAPAHDWDGLAPAVSRADKTDTQSGQDDESFVQGTKEDTAIPTVETGSIPPNKSDLTRFRIATEKVGTDDFMYLAWNRVNTLGSANMDFEFNQSSTLTSNGETPVRTGGDMLVTFDFASGGNKVELGLARWNPSGPCEANGAKPPCWGAIVDLDQAAVADGSVSADQRFGEAALNLTAAGVFPANQCVNFGSAYLKSRSSDSFTSALKDFVPPETVNLTNCGSVQINKADDAGNPLAGAGFTLYGDNAPVGGSRGPEDTATSLTCTTGASGTCTITNVFFGNYWVVETTVPAGYDAAADAAISVTNTTTVVVNLVDPRQRGAIRVVKTAKHFDTNSSPNLAATFTVKQNGTTVGTITTDGTTGLGCLGDLLLGSYTVEETSGPAGYRKDPDVETVAVDAKGTCASGYKSVSFENQPLSNITVSFASQVTGGTAASITCSGLTPDGGDTTPDAFDDTSETYKDLVEGTYSCTVVIDP
jgi:hypothetical protein